MAAEGGTEGGIWPRIPAWLQRSLFVTGVIAGPVTVVLGARELLDLSGPGWAVVLAWFASLLVTVSLVTVFVQQYRHHDALEVIAAQHRRDSAVATALPSVHLAFHNLRDAAVMIRDGDSEFAYRQRLVDSLAQMSDVFSILTGSPCRICIKVLRARHDAPDSAAPDDERYFTVSTLCRHDGSTDALKDAPSPLHENTDFFQVWSPAHSGRCFFSNDLDAELNYRNPHRDGDPSTFDYNSAIVWPIQRRQSEAPERYALLGFLCVDSKQKDVFRYQNDFELGAAYADTLYTVLSLQDGGTAKPATPAATGGGTSVAPN